MLCEYWLLGGRIMALMQCTECGKEFSDKANSCPNCGCPVSLVLQLNKEVNTDANNTKPERNRKKHFIIILSSIILIALIIGTATFLPKEMAYRNAITAMSAGENETALNSFAELSSYKDSSRYVNEIKVNIKEETYNEGVKAYRNGYFKDAITYFLKVKDYKESSYYILLIYTRYIRAHVDQDEELSNFLLFDIDTQNLGLDQPRNETIKELIANLDFEDTKNVILNSSYLEYFLEGSWETNDGNYYYSVTNTNGIYEAEFSVAASFRDGKFPEWSTSYNIPWYEGKHYKYENGIHFQGSDEAGWVKQFKITIKSKDEINIFSFKNNRSYALYRI